MTNQWRPDGATRTLAAPAAGTVIAYDYAAWTVLGHTDQPVELWDDRDRALVERYGPAAAPAIATLRPAHLDPAGPPQPGDLQLRYWPGVTPWWLYPDRHYPLCGHCRQPQPCREKDAARIAADTLALLERYSHPGVCPQCLEPVTAAQKAVTFPENVMWPLNEPVVFHVSRLACQRAADRYARRLAEHLTTRENRKEKP